MHEGVMENSWVLSLCNLVWVSLKRNRERKWWGSSLFYSEAFSLCYSEGCCLCFLQRRLHPVTVKTETWCSCPDLGLKSRCDVELPWAQQTSCSCYGLQCQISGAVQALWSTNDHYNFQMPGTVLQNFGAILLNLSFVQIWLLLYSVCVLCNKV